MWKKCCCQIDIYWIERWLMKTINQVCTQTVGEKLTCIGQVNVSLTLLFADEMLTPDNSKPVLGQWRHKCVYFFTFFKKE